MNDNHTMDFLYWQILKCVPIQDIKEGDKTPTQAPQEETNTLFQGRLGLITKTITYQVFCFQFTLLY